jgi:hypothetical protein
LETPDRKHSKTVADLIRKERIYYNLFQFMEEQNIMDPLNDSLVAALQYTFSYKINEKLNIWREAWAQHDIFKLDI